MKEIEHYIIPIFVPHLGCPNDCTFCNQRSISGQMKKMTKEEAKKTIETFLKSFKDDGLEREIAFFGGSFTGIEMSEQEELLICIYKLLEQEKQANILNTNLKEENEKNKRDIATYEEEIKLINKENIMLKKACNESKLKLDKLESEMTSHSCEQEINKSLNTRSKINEIKYQQTLDELTMENKELKSKYDNEVEKHKQDIQYEQLLNKKYKEDIEEYKRQIEYNEDKVKKLQNNITNLNKENEYVCKRIKIWS